ncbi:MAG: hypothetical protein COV74_09485 [Candidatus Omnitrophica bacterium CG11_big_fil_rev_8_21_14_0_20_45_26]|uniref:O-antigen ligase-related domain-containing protein n=1 Tax=Candidatus Abzuiibacterium crystallinum TaxID=1974748 RepID=A0A2H0LLB2_9BACT|nr:MAG: hypothetical protein COV74_09485 [Candidatus Omnitrophica bacterium CG11_big_fil_rev_8_21_14_0_20_45_26]PIW65377.1 MAG: hypothetical protein COW12_02055 [Candidatus Omnitrophica bacterium CG12_big_fil_rev_8_21_14_0_65_45_16]
MTRSSRFSAWIVFFFCLAAFYLPLSYALDAYQQEKFILLIGFALGFVRLMQSIRRQEYFFGWNILSVYFLLFTILVLAQYLINILDITAAGIRGSVYAYATREQFSRLIGLWVLLHLLVDVLTNRTRMKWLVGVIFSAGYLASILILMRRFFGLDLHESAFLPLTWLRFFPAIQPHPNQVAVFLELMVPLALGVCCYRLAHTKGWGREGGIRWTDLTSDGWFVSTAFLLFFLLMGVVATLSKVALAAVLIGIISFYLLTSKRYASNRLFAGLPVLIVAGGAVAFWLMGNQIQARFVDLKSQYLLTLGYRILLWERVLPLLSQFSLGGTGLGTFASSLSSLHRVEKHFFSPHLLNDYLEIWLESGWAGLCLWVVGFGLFFWHVTKWLRREESYFRRFLGGGLTGGLISLFTHSLMTSNLFDPANAFLALLFLGLIFALAREGGGDERLSAVDQKSLNGLRLMAVIVMGFFMGLGFYFLARDMLAHAFVGQTPTQMSYRHAIRIDGENAAYQGSLALLKENQAEFMMHPLRREQVRREALSHYQKAIALNPYQLIYRIQYSQLALQLKSYRQGEFIFSSFITSVPYDAEYLASFAFYYFSWADAEDHAPLKNKLIKQGLDLYQQALQLDPVGIPALRTRKETRLSPEFRQLLKPQLISLESA